MFCISCKKRIIVSENRCVACLLFYSDNEQQTYQQLITDLFERIPETILFNIEFQTDLVMTALPYTSQFTLQYYEDLSKIITRLIREVRGTYYIKYRNKEDEQWENALNVENN